MEYKPKSHGLAYLRHAVRHRNKKLNYITIPVEKANEILEASVGFSHPNKFDRHSNSVRGAAVILALDIKELCDRLNSPTPTTLMNDLAEARNKIKEMEKAGDALVHADQHISEVEIKAWAKARNLYV